MTPSQYCLSAVNTTCLSHEVVEVVPSSVVKVCSPPRRHPRDADDIPPGTLLKNEFCNSKNVGLKHGLKTAEAVFRSPLALLRDFANIWCSSSCPAICLPCFTQCRMRGNAAVDAADVKYLCFQIKTEVIMLLRFTN